jgi:carboxyl-terminal processing protease
MPLFQKAIEEAQQGSGLVLDLRGNPGGVGAMAMGIGGWLVEEKGRKLGTMIGRDFKLNFTVQPRAVTFSGPVAVLVDGCSASTSEILAGGLQDLGRARVFGTPTAGAALPSLIVKLPNGDAFQDAIANYVAEGGQALEGRGVLPDETAGPSREALLEGDDPALSAALAWIRTQAR